MTAHMTSQARLCLHHMTAHMTSSTYTAAKARVKTDNDGQANLSQCSGLNDIMKKLHSQSLTVLNHMNLEGGGRTYEEAVGSSNYMYTSRLTIYGRCVYLYPA